MASTNNFSAIQIGLASPEKIREWSYGEVKKTRNNQLPFSKTREGWIIL